MKYTTSVFITIIMIISIKQIQGIQLCQCENFGTLEACLSPCFWDSNQRTCNTKQPSCFNLTQVACTSPGCAFVNNACIKFNRCSDLIGDATYCKNFGCVSQTGLCADLQRCSDITLKSLCDQNMKPKSNSNALCQWEPIKQQCIDFAQCSDATVDLCLDLSNICSINNNQCQNVVCKNIVTQIDCVSKLNQCTWVSQSVGCISNSCNNNSNELTCLASTNRNFCAWDGKSCNQCLNINYSGSSRNYLYGIILSLSIYFLGM